MTKTSEGFNEDDHEVARMLASQIVLAATQMASEMNSKASLIASETTNTSNPMPPEVAIRLWKAADCLLDAMVGMAHRDVDKAYAALNQQVADFARAFPSLSKSDPDEGHA